MRKLTQEEFVAKAVAAHGVGRYDYSQAVYVGDRPKIKIGCPRHGLFEQQAGRHLAGAGCRKCGNITTANKKRKGREYFICRAQAVHGEAYDYSRVNYTSNSKPVEIICPAHGIFSQSLANHIDNGRGCPACGRIKQAATAKQLMLSTEKFIAKAQATHGYKYDYASSVVSGRNSKVEIRCPNHGFFMQVAFKHCAGNGCKKCANEQLAYIASKSWIERNQGKQSILYFLRIFSQDEIFYKIGITCQSVYERYRPKGSINIYQYEILTQHISQSASAIYSWEQSILEIFAHLRYQPKYSFRGETECFSEADPILAIFPL